MVCATLLQVNYREASRRTDVACVVMAQRVYGDRRKTMQRPRHVYHTRDLSLCHLRTLMVEAGSYYMY